VWLAPQDDLHWVNSIREVMRVATRQAADVAQALGRDAAGRGRNVNADPLALELLGRHEGGSAAAEGVEDDFILVAARPDDAFKERKRLLRGVGALFLCQVAARRERTAGADLRAAWGR